MHCGALTLMCCALCSRQSSVSSSAPSTSPLFPGPYLEHGLCCLLERSQARQEREVWGFYYPG